MTNFIMLIQLLVTVIMGIYFFNALKNNQTNKIHIDRENKKELDNLKKMRALNLTIPMTEKSRPTGFEEIVGQDKGIKALKAAICGRNPQHVIIYGPPGVGKTAAARLVLQYAKAKVNSPFKSESKFIEMDATTIRFDERGIADPLIGSVHDPIYQGAGAYGVAGIPQPKPGAVTKAHGGVLFIDEIGELHSVIMNKLLKVLEDRRVFFESSYYNSADPNLPNYVREVFENGLPADFRLIAATTRSPEEIPPALRSRCVEIYFRQLNPMEVEKVAKNCAEKCNVSLEESASRLIGVYATNGREAINIVQLSAGIAEEEGRREVLEKDVEWVIENGDYSPRLERKIHDCPSVGIVNGLGVFGANIGSLLEIEATATKVLNKNGTLKITGIVEEEELSSRNKKIIRKSSARCSIENVLTALERLFEIKFENYDVHVNFPGGMPVDGPSAGISMATAIYSAINKLPVDNKIAMSGEITLNGRVKAVGGIKAKVIAASKAGATRVIIPKENYTETLKDIKDIKIIPVDNFSEVIKLALTSEDEEETVIELFEEEGNSVAINAEGLTE
ncbi:MAG: ATP-dependent protease LonB [Clostridiaceae bacterium]